LIRHEVGKWTTAGIIQTDQEQRICQQYAQDCCGIAVCEFARLALFGLSAVAMVLALVLVATDHWLEINLTFKVGIALVAMLLAHGAGYFYRFHANDPQRGDACFFVGAVLYGFIVLMTLDHYYVSSLYWSSMLAWGLLVWAAGTLPLAWVLGSISLLLLANVVGVAWVIAQVIVSGDAAITVLFALQALCLMRWAYTNRSRALFVVTLASLVVWWFMPAVAHGLERAACYWLAAGGSLLILIGLRHEEDHTFTPIYKGVGIVLCGLTIPFLSLPSASRVLVESSFKQNEWLLVGLVLGVIVLYVPTSRRFNYGRDWPALAALSAVTALPAVLNILCYNRDIVPFATGLLVTVFNAAAIGVVVWFIRHGAATKCSASVLLGIGYFTLWAMLLTIDLAGDWTHAAVIFALASAAILVLVRLDSRKLVSLHETVPVENA
jgi:hypothetical protein